MSKFTFINENCGTQVKLSVDEEYLYEVVDAFEKFMKGCGFEFNERLIESESAYPNAVMAWTANQIAKHSKQKDTQVELKCTVCSIAVSKMEGWKCFDKKCPSLHVN